MARSSCPGRLVMLHLIQHQERGLHNLLSGLRIKSAMTCVLFLCITDRFKVSLSQADVILAITVEQRAMPNFKQALSCNPVPFGNVLPEIDMKIKT